MQQQPSEKREEEPPTPPPQSSRVAAAGNNSTITDGDHKKIPSYLQGTVLNPLIKISPLYRSSNFEHVYVAIGMNFGPEGEDFIAKQDLLLLDPDGFPRAKC